MKLNERSCDECGKGFKVLILKSRMFCGLWCRKTFYQKHPKLKDPEGKIQTPIFISYDEHIKIEVKDESL